MRYAAAVMAKKVNGDGHTIVRIKAAVVTTLGQDGDPCALAIIASQEGPYRPEDGWFEHYAVVVPIEEVVE